MTTNEKLLIPEGVNRLDLSLGFNVNSWGETSKKCFAPAFLLG